MADMRFVCQDSQRHPLEQNICFSSPAAPVIDFLFLIFIILFIIFDVKQPTEGRTAPYSNRWADENNAKILVMIACIENEIML